MPDAPKVAKATAPVANDHAAEDKENKANKEDQELVELREENARLREQLREAGVAEKPEEPKQPSFGISEGIRDQLERDGKAVDPFTGKTLTREDLKN